MLPFDRCIARSYGVVRDRPRWSRRQSRTSGGRVHARSSCVVRVAACRILSLEHPVPRASDMCGVPMCRMVRWRAWRRWLRPAQALRSGSWWCLALGLPAPRGHREGGRTAGWWSAQVCSACIACFHQLLVSGHVRSGSLAPAFAVTRWPGIGLWLSTLSTVRTS